MAISVKLEAFEGPLDLLLHLIDKNKLNIYDIPIAVITDQYMEYINAMDKKDLNVMSEFLVMAATLLDIKARMLLPAETDESGEEEDPRAELVQKLLEYKMYKYMSYELRDRYMDSDHTMYKTATLPEEVASYQPPIDYEELIGDLNLIKLGNIFAEIMKKQVEKIDPIRSKFGKIEKEEVSMDDKVKEVRSYIASHERFSFRELLGKSTGKIHTIVTFLVVLELIKSGVITVSQEAIADDINITVLPNAIEIMDTAAETLSAGMQG